MSAVRDGRDPDGDVPAGAAMPVAPGPGVVPSPVWLAHHTTEHYDRCIVVGRRHVCRRCAVLWPVTFAALAVSMTVGLWPPSLDAALLFLLPVPAVVDFVLEQRRVLAYRASRQLAVSVPLGLALGRGFHRYLDDPADGLFWGMVVLYGVLAVGSAVSRAIDDAA